MDQRRSESEISRTPHKSRPPQLKGPSFPCLGPLVVMVSLGQLQCAGLEATLWQGCWTEVSKLPWCSSSSQLPWLNYPRTGNLVSADPLSYFAQTNRISGHPISKILLFWRLPMRKLGAAIWILQMFRTWNTFLSEGLVWWEMHQPTRMTWRCSLRWHKEKTPSKKEDGTLRRVLQLWGIKGSLLYKGKILQCHKEHKDAVYIHCLVSASYFILNFPADPAALC